MRALALVTALVFSLAIGLGQKGLPPITIRGSASVQDNQTKYVIEFWNNSDLPVEGMSIRYAGMFIHYMTFNPEFKIPTIPPGKKHTFTVWVRGTLAPGGDTDLIGVQGRYYQGTRRYDLFFKRPKNCPPPNNGL